MGTVIHLPHPRTGDDEHPGVAVKVYVQVEGNEPINIGQGLVTDSEIPTRGVADLLRDLAGAVDEHTKGC